MMNYINPPVRRREGMGFSNAGVHIPHANAYPIAGRVRDYHPAGYPADESMVPHRISVALATTASRTRPVPGRVRLPAFPGLQVLP